VIERGVFLAASLAFVGSSLIGIGTAGAQDVIPPPEVRLIAGIVKTYLDEPAQPAAGVGFRIALTPRLSFEPEVLRVTGQRFQNWHILGNVTYSLSRSVGVIPYVVFGIGLNRELDTAINYRFTQKELNGGFGVRIPLSDRVFISPEGRLGLTTLPRLTVALGVKLR
jgi:hypothetical protein